MLKQYYKEIYLYVKRTIFDENLTEDVTQEVFARVIKKTYNKDIEYKRALLYRVAKNVMIDLYRKRNKINNISFDEDMFFQDENIIEKQLIEIEQKTQLMNAINKLPKKRQEVFTLYIINGYSRKEIANIMGISFNAVEQHLSRASNQLKNFFQSN